MWSTDDENGDASLADVYNEDLDDDDDNSDYVEEAEGDEEDSDLGEEEEDDAGTEQTTQPSAEGMFAISWLIEFEIELDGDVSVTIFIDFSFIFLLLISPCSSIRSTRHQEKARRR